MRIRLASFVAAYADDFCYVAGVTLVGIGVYRLCPVATWFYAGAVCLAIGWLQTLASGRRA